MRNNEIPNHFAFDTKGAIYYQYVTISSCNLFKCEDNMSFSCERIILFVRKLTYIVYFIGFYMIKAILIQLSWVAELFLFLKETYTLVERSERQILQKQLSTSQKLQKKVSFKYQ